MFQKGPSNIIEECWKYLKRECSDENIYETDTEAKSRHREEGTNRRDIKKVHLIRLIEKLEEGKKV